MSNFIPLWQAAVTFGTVILFGALGELITEKSGNLNLGTPGIMYLGGIASLIGAFFYENGKVARIEMKAYQTASNRRKLTGAYSDKSPLACIRRLDEDCELAVYSNEPRCLIFHTALLAPKTTRSAQGVAVMTLKPKYHLETVLLSEETSITNRTRYRVRAIPAAGALVKEEDSEDQQISLL